MKTKTRYVRLLSYENAIKVIDWVMAKGGKNYAYITPGGIGVQMFEQGFEELKNFVESLTGNYEITDEHPKEVEQGIVEQLRKQEII